MDQIFAFFGPCGPQGFETDARFTAKSTILRESTETEPFGIN